MNLVAGRKNIMATTADEVWQLLGELIQSQKETERLLQELVFALADKITHNIQAIARANNFKQVQEFGDRFLQIARGQFNG